MKNFLAVGVLLFLLSCANPYAQFYQGIPDARIQQSYESINSELKIYRTDNVDRDAQALMRRGYSPIGHSSFNAASNSLTESQLREQAAKVGAHVVLVTSNYTHTVSGALPMSIPQTTTSYSSGTATAYGPGGTVNAYGSGTTTTYGSQTVMMPYSVARSEFGALFFAKTKARLGVFPRDIDDVTRRRLQTNAGVSVFVVAEGTPAFAADVLPGDIILAIGDDSIQSVGHFFKLLDKYQSQRPLFKIDRAGKSLEKQIEIQPYNTKAPISYKKIKQDANADYRSLQH